MFLQRWLAVATLGIFATACSTVPESRVGAGCSGIPGDLRTPASGAVAAAATHGPGGSGLAVERVAIARPPGPAMPDERRFPLLYVFGADGEHIMRGDPRAEFLRAPAFVRAETGAYWGEVVDGAFYRIPELDKCSQSALLDGDLAFFAPTGGLLFVQYLAPGCKHCSEVTAAIEALIATNPALPVRWERINVPKAIGGLRDDGPTDDFQ